MKTLGACFESLLDDDDVFYDPKNDKNLIVDWIKSNYIITGKLTISDDLVVDCTGSTIVRNTSITALTNGMFKWGDVRGDFDCNSCKNLTSLKGTPEKIGGGFDCSDCVKLKSLEGVPRIIGGGFYCESCINLKSLKGAPEEVRGFFGCSNCVKLKSLEGAPKKVGGFFSCSSCGKLKSLEGAPEEVLGYFICLNCPNLVITDSDRKKYKIKD